MSGLVCWSGLLVDRQLLLGTLWGVVVGCIEHYSSYLAGSPSQGPMGGLVCWSGLLADRQLLLSTLGQAGSLCLHCFWYCIVQTYRPDQVSVCGLVSWSGLAADRQCFWGDIFV